MKPVLIVDNEEKFCKVVKTAIELENIEAEYVTSGELALAWLKEHQAEIVITDIRMEGIDGLEVLRQVKTDYPDIEVIIMTAFATQKTAVDALKDGAFDYLIKPFEMDELVLRIRRIYRQKTIVEENRMLKAQTGSPISFNQIVGRSLKMRKVYNLIEKAAATDSTVLILGESGTGKELVSEVIHHQSARAKEQIIALNCAALPENLLESELFGHEKGAFTGATQRKIGKFEITSKGTLFLDEIGDLTIVLQAKLLRVLQNKEIFRLGGNERISVNSRIIAATHRNLEDMVSTGQFRQDLYYRLNIFPIEIPPLRGRKEDIPELVNHFIKQYNIVGIDRGAMKALMEYDWPGNIRELQNVIERASILADSIINLDDLPALKNPSQNSFYQYEIPDQGFELDTFEKFLIEQALNKSQGNKTRAAEILGITRRRLYSIMDRFGISS